MFVVLYLFVFALGALSLVLDARRVGGQLGAFEALGAAASCLGNVGPAFGSAGPFGSYAGFSDLSKVMLSILMLLGTRRDRADRRAVHPLLLAPMTQGEDSLHRSEPRRSVGRS